MSVFSVRWRMVIENPRQSVQRKIEVWSVEEEPLLTLQLRLLFDIRYSPFPVPVYFLDQEWSKNVSIKSPTFDSCLPRDSLSRYNVGQSTFRKVSESEHHVVGIPHNARFPLKRASAGNHGSCIHQTMHETQQRAVSATWVLRMVWW